MEGPQSPPPPAKPPPTSGARPTPKVSQIANIFETMQQQQQQADGGNTSANQQGGPAHNTRFSVARAMFERMGESHDGPPRPPPHHGVLVAPPPAPKPAIKQEKLVKSEKLVVNTQLLRSNGHAAPPPKPPKPEKPERKFSSKELIEKQRNWTAHFKNRPSSRSPADRPQPPPHRPPLIPAIKTPLLSEKQEREIPEKPRDAWSPAATPPSPVSPAPHAVSPTLSATESSADSTADKTLSDFSEPSPGGKVVLSPNAEKRDLEQELDAMVQHHNQRKRVTVQLLLASPNIDKKIDQQDKIESPEVSPLQEKADSHEKLHSSSDEKLDSSSDEKLMESSSDEKLDEKSGDKIDMMDDRTLDSSMDVELDESPVKSIKVSDVPVLDPEIKAALDLNDVKFVDDEISDSSSVESASSSEVSASEATHSSLPSKELSSPDNETPPTLPPRDMSPEVDLLPPLPLAPPTSLPGIPSQPPRRPLPPSPIEEKLPELPENNFMARSAPPLPPHFNETPPPLPPKDIPEYAFPMKLKHREPPVGQANDPEPSVISPDDTVAEDESEEEEEEEEEIIIKDTQQVAAAAPVSLESEPETMTQDEAELLLSTRPAPLLSDEEAREVHLLLETQSPPSSPQTAEILGPKIPDITTPNNKIIETEPQIVPEPEPVPPKVVTPETPPPKTVETPPPKTVTPEIAPPKVVTPEAPKVITPPKVIQQQPPQYAPPQTISPSQFIPQTAQSQPETVTSQRQDSALDYREASDISGVETLETSDHPVIELVTDDDTDGGYVPIPCREVLVENGVHYLEDGHFWVEVPGLPSSDDEEEFDESVTIKAPSRVSFSAGPMKMYSTHSVSDYDRRNDDVDPVAASAEYELEKRVEKMDVFPVELLKGPEGLGLSIIGMGVGADAGLEKLGIFVKTITEQGAASRDARIHVNDQIIEVDGKSLVGVTQAYAASVLRNTSGLVKFLIGREKDPENSEVAQLIKQSLQADRERDERRHGVSHHQASSPGDGDLTPQDGVPPAPPPHRSQPIPSAADLEAMRQLVKESQYKLAVADADIARLKQRLAEQERQGGEEVTERLKQASQRLREMERGLAAAKKEVAAYQDMLEQSQGQHITLEKKYSKAKKLLREFQQREQDLLHREEFHLQLLQEKDTEYNALVKTLKDRIIQLEQELLETQKAAGLSPQLPYDNNKHLSPQLPRKQKVPVVPPLKALDAEISDNEDGSPEDNERVSTVERKVPVKEELDRAVPPHELLDVSASRSRADLVKNSSALANRQLPTPSKKSPISTSGSDFGFDAQSYQSAEEEEESIRVVTETYSSESLSNEHLIPTQFQIGSLERPPRDRAVLISSSLQPERPGSLPGTLQKHSQQPIYQRTTAKHESNFSSMQAVYVSRSSYTAGQQQPQVRAGIGPPASLAEQLKQVLAERERRISTDDPVQPDNSLTQSTTSLVEEIRQAVQEANARVKRSAPLDSPRGSPSSLSSSCSSVSPALHRSGDTGSPENVWISHEQLPTIQPPDRRPSNTSTHFWQNAPVSQWSKEQVCQWLLALGLEAHIPKFLEHSVSGNELLLLESKDLKTLGVGGDDKSRFKRKLKDLRAQEERERKQHDKERREREKLQKKAEKLAEKASKSRK